MNKAILILKTIINIFVRLAKNPGDEISYLIIATFGDLDRIPDPFFSYVTKRLGHWAGFGIYMEMREYRKKLKRDKFYKFISGYFLPLIILAVMITSLFLKSNNFLFGFFQNLLSDIILILLAIYILPKQLNKPQKYNLALEQMSIYNQKYDEKDKIEIVVSILNNGEIVYKKEEIYWEIYIPLDALNKRDIKIINGDFEIGELAYFPMWKFYGANDTPLFLGQNQSIVKLIFKLDSLYQSRFPPLKIYYLIRTINGNIPTIDKVTNDFQGMGIPFDEYPKVAELVFTDWRNPNEDSNKYPTESL